jgi:DNA-binding Lrp family transcriptional regulator
MGDQHSDATRPAAFLLIKTKRNSYELVQRLQDESLVEWAAPVYGPYQVIAYAGAESPAALTAFIEALREWPEAVELDARMCKAIPGDESLRLTPPAKPQVATLLICVDHREVKERDVTYRLREHKAVVWARAMWGPDDIIALVQADDPESMRNVICDDVKVMRGVIKNTTLYAYPRTWTTRRTAGAGQT